MDTENDFKSQVYKWAQKLNRQVAFSYRDEFDSASKKISFTADLRIDHELFGEGKGSSKKEAEQEASLLAWKKILRMGFIE
ncbi:MAG: putative dsRNA-binding protein [Bacteroidales bacterium]